MTAGAILEEIDAIFASRPKPTGSKQAKPTKAEEAKPNKRVLSDPASDRKQKKKKSKSKLNSTHEITTTDLQAVEEVFDPSAAIVQASVPLPVSDFLDESGSGGCKGTRTKVVLDEEELAFRDSRGTRPKTDDGLPIYSVEELKIGLGGDTDACPFDCQCCF